MTRAIIELALWSPEHGRRGAIDQLLADPATPLAKHGLTGIASAYARMCDCAVHPDHEAWHRALTTRSLAVDGSLTDLAEIYADTGLMFFIAKGPAVAHRLYQEPSLRPYCDLDVYVTERDAPVLRQLLAERGYRPVRHAPGVLNGLAQEMHGGPFGATVEVHTTVVDNVLRTFVPPLSAYMDRVEVQVIAGSPVPVLSNSAHLSIQLIHAAAGHRYARLILLRDLLMNFSDGGWALCEHDEFARFYGDVYVALFHRLGLLEVDPTPHLRSRLVSGALGRRDPAHWDEYALSLDNVLSLIVQPSVRASIAVATTALRSPLRPRGDRRVNLRRSTSHRPVVR